MSEPEATRSAVWKLTAELVAAQTETQAAAAIARASAVITGAEAVRVWMIDSTEGYRFAGSWPEEDDRPKRASDNVARAVVFGTPVASEGHRPWRSFLVVPLMAGPRPLGAIELLEKKRPAGPFAHAESAVIADLVVASDAALAAVRDRARRERDHIEVAARLIRLFDIGRSFARCLEEPELVKIVVSRIESALEVEGAYLWLIDSEGETLRLAAAAGPFAPAVAGWELSIGEGLAGRVAASGEPLLISGEEAIEELGERPETKAGARLSGLAAAPVAPEDGPLLGVVEIVNREGTGRLGREDLVFLGELAETAAIALGNARRLDAERRASDLGSLLTAAQMLGGSLDVQKVTYTLVHQGASVVRYKRAAVGLFKGARLSLAAVSGQTFVDEKLPAMESLRRILEWAAGLDEGLYVVQEEDGEIDADRPETREKFRAFFEETGARSCLLVPLKDDGGRVGVLGFEADEPYAFSDRDIEAAGILAVQGTLAIRNAMLYQQVPMARLFRSRGRSTRAWAWTIGSGLAVALLALVPVPLRVGGAARVLPEGRLPVTAEVDGRIASVLVREGDAVVAGQPLATLDSAELRAQREQAASRVAAGMREQTRLRAAGEAAAAAMQTARLDGFLADLALAESRLAGTTLRSPGEGVIATPRVDEKAGMRLARGELFCEIVDPLKQQIEIAVPEADSALVGVGMPAKVKLSAYPTRSFAAVVESIGVVAIAEQAIPPVIGTDAGTRGTGESVEAPERGAAGDRVFLVRARLEEPVSLRSGMTGQARITTGRRSLGGVLFRRPARWAWKKIWGWLP